MYDNGLMDDLEVMPMSTISNITLLNKFNVATVGDLEEKVVHLSMQKVCEFGILITIYTLHICYGFVLF